MKITTTFWSDQQHEFKELFYVNGKTKEIIFKTNLDNKFETYLFFKNIAKFVKSKQVLKTLNNICWNDQVYFQFATMYKEKITFLKWFELIINDKVKISHDIAFETTLIKKNNVQVPFGHFPMSYYKNNIDPKLPKYREFKIKSRAYNFIGNEIKRELEKVKK